MVNSGISLVLVVLFGFVFFWGSAPACANGTGIALVTAGVWGLAWKCQVCW